MRQLERALVLQQLLATGPDVVAPFAAVSRKGALLEDLEQRVEEELVWVLHAAVVHRMEAPGEAKEVVVDADAFTCYKRQMEKDKEKVCIYGPSSFKAMSRSRFS